MNRQLILIKHSLPEVVENRPANQWLLSKEGQVRAERLARKLIQFEPEVIFTSKESKARETAEIIARIHQLDLHIVENLHEHERGNVPYLPQDHFESSIHEFFQKPDTLVFGNETANQCYARFSEAVDSILKTYVDKTVAIVAHGTVISLFVARRTGISDELLWKELGLPSFLVINLQSNTVSARENNV